MYFLAFASVGLLPLSARADIVMDLTYVGNPGNAPDYDHPLGPPYDPRYVGAVNYQYYIGTYEVTVAQYAEFLNAVAQSDPYGLYNGSMETDPMVGAIILRSGADGSYTYTAVSGKENQPVRWVSEYDAMRFSNWMANGQGTGDTETGSYDMSGGVYATRSTNATWVIPSEDEWYKAAYYSASNLLYYNYPNGSDAVPQEPTDETTPREMNFGDVPFWQGSVCFTSTGQTTGASPYGTYDQGGNAAEWTDTMDQPPYQHYRITRGGDFQDQEDELSSSIAVTYTPDTEGYIGLRLAYIIPEPSAFLLLFSGLPLLWCFWRRGL